MVMHLELCLSAGSWEVYLAAPEPAHASVADTALHVGVGLSLSSISARPWGGGQENISGTLR